MSNEPQIDTHRRQIRFCGCVFKDWRDINWLRTQLNVLEINGVALWGPPESKREPKKSADLHVLKGGKDEAAE